MRLALCEVDAAGRKEQALQADVQQGPGHETLSRIYACVPRRKGCSDDDTHIRFMLRGSSLNMES